MNQPNNTTPQRPRQGTKTTTRMSQRQRLMLVGGAISTLIIVLIVLFYNSMKTTPGKAAVTDDYRSKTTGNWSSASTWERYNGTTWVNAVSAPSSTNNVITIQNGHTVTLTSNVTADQLVVDAGGRININSGQTLTIANGAGTDVANSGIIATTGTFTMNASATMNNLAGSEYIHSRNGGTIPTATWAATSTCNITGVTGTMPGGFPQNFGNLTWNCTGQTGVFVFNTNISIQGDFNLQSTSANRLILNDGLTARTFTVGGNYNQTGGNLRLSDGFTAGTLNVGGDCNISAGELMGNNNFGSSTISITGNLNLSGTGALKPNSTSVSSTLNISGSANVTGGTLTVLESSGNCTMNVAGDFSATGGTITETGTGTALINFNGSSMQTYTSGSTISNSVNFNVNANAYLQMADASTTVSGGGYFTLTNGGKLGITSTAGITSSGATGNIRVTGTRTFNTGADYIYNGTSAQTTGNGLPATNRNLAINNAAGVTLTSSTNSTGTITFTSGNVTTNGNTLTLGTSTASTGTLSRTSGHVIGNFRRWVASAIASNILFPLGTSTDYNGYTISFTSAPTGGTITGTFTTGFPGVYGLPINDAGDECSTIGSGWWTFTGANGFTGGTMTMAAQADGFTGINDYTILHLFQRIDNANTWTANGTHQAPTGSASSPIVNRTGVTALGQFGITSNSSNPLPVKLTRFDVKESKGQAVINWSTASEVNNDYFMVQKSTNGQDFTDLKKVNGAGTSNTVHNYSVTDPQPAQGINYYRLRQVDMNGQTEIFGPKSVTIGSKTSTSSFSHLTASPNPFQSNLSIQFESAREGTTTMQIYNAAGKEIYTGSLEVTAGNNNIYLPLADKMRPGSYIIRIGEGTDAVKVNVIKQ
ncbi:MAG: T9SS type A sorting domain-containing protein [Bacteroidia bacterium]